MSEQDDRIYLNSLGEHILPPSYHGGIFVRVDGLEHYIPMDVDLQGLQYSLDGGSSWDEIPVIEPIKILAPGRNNRLWVVASLLETERGTCLTLVKPVIYDAEAIERTRRIFTAVGIYILNPGDIFGVRVSLAGTKSELRMAIAGNGLFFSLEGNWAPIQHPEGLYKLAISIPKRGTWVVAYLGMNGAQIQLELITPYRMVSAA